MEKCIQFISSLGTVRVQVLHPFAIRDSDALEKFLGKTPLQVCWFNSLYL